MAVRKNTHIQIEFLYTIVSYRAGSGHGAASSTCMRIAFFALSTYLAYKVMVIMQFQYMAVVDWPLSYVYGAVFLGYAAMTIRAVQVIVRHWVTKTERAHARRTGRAVAMILLLGSFLVLLAIGFPVALALGGVVDAVRLHRRAHPAAGGGAPHRRRRRIPSR